MTARKTPVLLRRGPLTGSIVVLTRYTRKQVGGGEVPRASADGKHDVTADFDALVCEMLLDHDSPGTLAILGGVIDGSRLTAIERAQVRAFRERLKGIVERHNNSGHGASK